MTDNGLDLRAVKTFPSLVKYLRDELDWPIESDDVEDLTFDYEPEELGLDAKTAVKIKEIKQLRPLASNQPWGIFFVNFEPKQLPIVALRRILRALVFKKRESGSRAQQKTWQLNDLLFISSYGDSSERAITLAHFSEESEFGDLPTLRVLGWDAQDTVLHLEDAEQTLKTKLHWPDNAADVESWRSTWASAFTLRPHEVVRTSRELAVKLADLATVIRERANKVLAIESASGPFRKLHQAFQEALIHDLSQDDFADMYAQTIAYGLLTAHVSRPAGLVAENIVDIVPNTNPFLKELLGTFLRVGGRKGKIDFDELGINDVVELLRDADMDAVLRDFGDRNPNEDPVIHFYELFLKEYDPVKRMKRGVFYTPRPVVSFIVRSVDEILRTEFGLEDGLADVTTWGEMAERNAGLEIPKGVLPEAPFVQILDPATGTGTFLVEVIEVIHKTMVEKWRKQGTAVYDIRLRWDDYVQRDLLPRLYGFELMMAPYAIAHMKIGLKLRETEYSFFSSERARVYLTNTLEEPKDFSDYFEQMAPALAHEAQAANKIKRGTPITVVIGNPPYSNFGHLNRNEFILGLLDDYKRDLDEKKINLDDDFIKFVRFSQHLLDRTGTGIFGAITNNSFVDGITHRQMRHSLLGTLSRIYVQNLHGSSKKKERAPDGSLDENVFDIQQGVAITVGVKLPTHEIAAVLLQHLWGKRDTKYSALNSATTRTGQWTPLSPCQPYFFFVEKKFDVAAEYNEYLGLKSVFIVSGNGVKTERDGVSIHFTRREIEISVRDFQTLTEDTLREKYHLGNDSRDWTVKKAKADVEAHKGQALYRQILYRPFDFRHTWYSGQTRGFIGTPAFPTMRNMRNDNIAMVTTRQTVDKFDLVCTDKLVGHKSVAAYDINTAFPLFLFDDMSTFDLGDGIGVARGNRRRPNFKAPFLKALAQSLRVSQRSPDSLPEGLTTKDVFNYAYAVFHGPEYRARYAEFLKIDFPRLPLTSSIDLFRALAEVGGELVNLHLLESPVLNRRITTYTGPANSEVEKVSYSRGIVWLDKAQTCGFRGVPEKVYSFHIGGFQVCEKWLKDRRGRTLSDEDITHYQRVVVALNETIRLMGQIDAVIEEHGGWPLVGSQDAPKPSEPDQLPFS